MTPLAFSRQKKTSPASPSLALPRLARTLGFSLIEMLVVIMIIGILAAILIPMITRIGDGANSARHRRQAQSLATTYQAGITAGADFLVPGDIEQTIERIVTGATVQNGVFTGQFFRVPGLDDTARDAAARYLSLDGDRLIYQPQG